MSGSNKKIRNTKKHQSPVSSVYDASASVVRRGPFVDVYNEQEKYNRFYDLMSNISNMYSYGYEDLIPCIEGEYLVFPTWGYIGETGSIVPYHFEHYQHSTLTIELFGCMIIRAFIGSGSGSMTDYLVYNDRIIVIGLDTPKTYFAKGDFLKYLSSPTMESGMETFLKSSINFNREHLQYFINVLKGIDCSNFERKNLGKLEEAFKSGITIIKIDIDDHVAKKRGPKPKKNNKIVFEQVSHQRVSKYPRGETFTQYKCELKLNRPKQQGLSEFIHASMQMINHFDIDYYFRELYLNMVINISIEDLSMWMPTIMAYGSEFSSHRTDDYSRISTLIRIYLKIKEMNINHQIFEQSMIRSASEFCFSPDYDQVPNWVMTMGNYIHTDLIYYTVLCDTSRGMGEYGVGKLNDLQDRVKIPKTFKLFNSPQNVIANCLAHISSSKVSFDLTKVSDFEEVSPIISNITWVNDIVCRLLSANYNIRPEVVKSIYQ